MTNNNMEVSDFLSGLTRTQFYECTEVIQVCYVGGLHHCVIDLDTLYGDLACITNSSCIAAVYLVGMFCE